MVKDRGLDHGFLSKQSGLLDCKTAVTLGLETKLLFIESHYIWWLVEVPYWFKASLFSQILGIFITQNQLDNFMRGEIYANEQPKWNSSFLDFLSIMSKINSIIICSNKILLPTTGKGNVFTHVCRSVPGDLPTRGSACNRRFCLLRGLPHRHPPR